ncbi:M15 family metallopeptidase [Photobacterium sp. SDRW27]|uniref:M15 family metallopeptidase n=1 Tax=Photobacterium obscurum TaxID=2829490 RepID=UPI0022444B2D|nr:M15 family metallopeptidase [Photobacterium obscurum]MCW8330948.1 M15 family metallopeptidase [Photobacterium obscurum]
MASRKLGDLTEAMRDKAETVQRACKEAGEFELLIYCTLRPLEEQARLFRQSRSRQQIDLKSQKFRSRGLVFLADILESVGPCYGDHVTNAAPGESWHNYGQAFDAVPLIGGKPAWNYMKARSYWDAYGEAVRQTGLYWAGDWQRFREYPHAQLNPGGNPLKSMNADEVYTALQENGLLSR